jgi:hypothetical protein
VSVQDAVCCLQGVYAPDDLCLRGIESAEELVGGVVLRQALQQEGYTDGQAWRTMPTAAMPLDLLASPFFARPSSLVCLLVVCGGAAALGSRHGWPGLSHLLSIPSARPSPTTTTTTHLILNSTLVSWMRSW